LDFIMDSLYVWYCGYEETDRGTEPTAISQNMYVYLETVEETKD